jgi:hypothetical protein
MEISLGLPVAGRPLLLAVLLALIAAALLRGRAATRAATLTAMAGGLAALAAYAGIAALYAVDPRYFDPAEPTIPIVGWLFTLGEPIYHDVDADARYAHIYGPLAFILPGLVLQALGPGIVVSKLLGVAGGLGSLALTYASLRTAAGRGRALRSGRDRIRCCSWRARPAC